MSAAEAKLLRPGDLAIDGVARQMYLFARHPAWYQVPALASSESQPVDEPAEGPFTMPDLLCPPYVRDACAMMRVNLGRYYSNFGPEEANLSSDLKDPDEHHSAAKSEDVAHILHGQVVHAILQLAEQAFLPLPALPSLELAPEEKPKRQSFVPEVIPDSIWGAFDDFPESANEVFRSFETLSSEISPRANRLYAGTINHVAKHIANTFTNNVYGVTVGWQKFVDLDISGEGKDKVTFKSSNQKVDEKQDARLLRPLLWFLISPVFLFQPDLLWNEKLGLQDWLPMMYEMSEYRNIKSDPYLLRMELAAARLVATLAGTGFTHHATNANDNDPHVVLQPYIGPLLKDWEELSPHLSNADDDEDEDDEDEDEAEHY